MCSSIPATCRQWHELPPICYIRYQGRWSKVRAGGWLDFQKDTYDHETNWKRDTLYIFYPPALCVNLCLFLCTGLNFCPPFNNHMYHCFSMDKNWSSNLQGDCLKEDRFCFWISPIPIEVQSSIIARSGNSWDFIWYRGWVNLIITFLAVGPRVNLVGFTT